MAVTLKVSCLNAWRYLLFGSQYIRDITNLTKILQSFYAAH